VNQDASNLQTADASIDLHGAPPGSRDSIWMSQPGTDSFGELTHDLSVDVAVVGGGITGITTALQLIRQGRKVAVLEAGRIGGSNTGHSTGNLYATTSESLYALGQKWGDDVAEAVVRSRGEAVDLIERNIAEYRLTCDFARVPWALYAMSGGSAENDRIRHEYDAARGAGLDAKLENDLALPYAIGKALVVRHQAQFNPFLYVRQLAAAIRSTRCQIFERARVRDIDIEQGTVATATHRVRADHIVMATHTPKGISILQTEMLPYRECGIAAEMPERQLPPGIFWSAGSQPVSVRLAEIAGKPYLVMIGERHKTGHVADMNGAHQRLEQQLRARFRTEAPAFYWSAQQYRSADGLPYIGSSVGSSHVYLATGFGADGLTYGTLAGMLIADEICGNRNPYAQLYSPRRFTPIKSAKNFLKENMDVAAHLIKDYTRSQPVSDLSDIGRGEASLLTIASEKLAAYRDEQDRLHVVSAVCTHMKCLVHWNPSERSWDCPCHGSRFHYDGSVIEGPAMMPLKRHDPDPDVNPDATPPV
jgi:glycine/D-amino acid oxidase-like deaminating enzyme/nitrite reductase/ring-hydroxylating ferredoxin subunit